MEAYHNDYPVIIPALSATLAQSMGYWNETIPKFSHIIILISPLLILLGFLKYKLLQLSFLTMFAMVCGEYIYNGNVDPALAIYLSACACLLQQLINKETALSLNTPHWSYFIALTTLTSITLLIKNEGLPFILVIYATALIIAKDRNKKYKSEITDSRGSLRSKLPPDRFRRN